MFLPPLCVSKENRSTFVQVSGLCRWARAWVHYRTAFSVATYISNLRNSRAALSSGVRFSLALESMLRMLKAKDLLKQTGENDVTKRKTKYDRITAPVEM